MTVHLRPVQVPADALFERVAVAGAAVAAARTRAGVAVCVAVPAADAAGAVGTALDAIAVAPGPGGPAAVEAVSAVGPGEVEDPASLTGELDLVDFDQMTELLEVSAAALSDFVASPRFPRPAAYLSHGPVWRRTDVLALLGHATVPPADGCPGG